MKKLSSTLLLLALLLGACSNSGDATESAATQKPELTRIALTVPITTKSVVTETVVPVRKAVISDIKKEVSARVLSSKNFAPASIGMNILPSGGVKTGVDGRAKLDLIPEGTIVRVISNSSFTISKITKENSQPKTTIELLYGKIFILLNGGSLDVKTSMGVASVRGSLLRVEYDPEKKLLKASCLEGHCSLKTKDSKVVELISGEFSFIEDGQTPVDPKKIYCEEIKEWLNENPELLRFIEELPIPENYPEQNPGQCDNITSGNDKDNPTAYPTGYPNP